MTEEDFPAAHSMDTHWFAVDSEGNVGCFNTGEAGAAPNCALEFENAEPPSYDEILKHFPRDSQIEYHVDDLIAMQGGPVFDYSYNSQSYLTASFSDNTSCYSVLLWLKDDRILDGSMASLLGKISDCWTGFRLISELSESTAFEIQLGLHRGTVVRIGIATFGSRWHSDQGVG